MWDDSNERIFENYHETIQLDDGMREVEIFGPGTYLKLVHIYRHLSTFGTFVTYNLNNLYAYLAIASA